MAGQFGNLRGSVFAAVPAFSFSAAQEDECRAFLIERSTHTESIPVVDPAQLLMAADGSIAETGYRFNAIGFAALANSLGRGLNSLFNELVGESHNNFDAAARAGQVAKAAQIYNTALKCRFDSLLERHILLNHRDKTIDGFLGLEHKFVANSSFFDLLINEVLARQDAAAFYRAELIGREFRVFFSDTASRRNNFLRDRRHTFGGGWYFSNREDTGRSIRGALCLLTKFGVAIEPKNKKNCLRHTGSDLMGRLISLTSHCAGRSLQMDDVCVAVRRMRKTSLHFSSNKKHMDAATNKVVRYLGQYKVNKEDARRICKNTFAVGSDVTPRPLVEAYADEVVEARNLYDLFCALLRYARNQYYTTRDVLQAAGMEMLKLPERK